MEIQNHQKQSMLAQGEWRPAAVGDAKTAGFHLSSLYSPVGWFSWAGAAKQFEQAHKNPALLQVFVNTVLGETWALRGEAPDWQRLYDRREDYRIGNVPDGGLFLTAGIDIQKDRIEVEVVAWGRGKESWSVDYQVLAGQTAEAGVWQKLTAVLDTYYLSVTGASLPITMFAIDSGYATAEVYAWARQHGGPRAVVIKGDAEHRNHLGGLAASARARLGLRRFCRPFGFGRGHGRGGLLGRLGLGGRALGRLCAAFGLSFRLRLGGVRLGLGGFAQALDTLPNAVGGSLGALEPVHRLNARQAVPNGHQALRRPSGDQFRQFLLAGEGVNGGGSCGGGFLCGAKRRDVVFAIDRESRHFESPCSAYRGHGHGSLRSAGKARRFFNKSTGAKGW
ncbi:MAG: terminase gpA endonuclease subunit [Bryobacteraceae bacterium]